MKLSFSTNAFLHHNLTDALRAISATGYRGVEIMADVPHAYPSYLTEADVAEIRRTLDRTGLEIANVNAFMHHADGDTYHPSWIEPEAELRKKRVDYTLGCIDLAARLGATCLSTEPGGPLEGMTRERGLELFLEGLRQVEDAARKKRVRILIEPEPGLLIESSGQFLEFYKGLDPEVFGLNFDIGHFFCVGEDPVGLVKTLGPMAHHFHLEDIAADRRHHHLLPGEGAIDLPAVLSAIHGTGYKGFVTVELYTYASDAEGAAWAAMRYLREKAPAGVLI